MGTDEVAVKVLAVAGRQHGAIARVQAYERGANRYWLEKAVANGLLEPWSRDIFIVRGSPRTWQQELTCGVLRGGPGARAGASAALALWADELAPPSELLVLVQRGRVFESPAGMRVVQAGDIDTARWRVLDGIPCCGLPRALFDLAATEDVDEIVRCVDAARRANKSMSILSLGDVLQKHRKSGRPAVRTFEAALRKVVGTKVTDSEFEGWVRNDFRRLGGPQPRFHHVVTVNGVVYELDFAWPEITFNYETDGGDHELRVRRIRADKRRDRALTRAGWTVSRLDVETYITEGPGDVEETMAYVRSLLG